MVLVAVADVFFQLGEIGLTFQITRTDDNRRFFLTDTESRRSRVTNGAMLLTRIARCPHCGGGMSLRTGKSGLYRYYACASAASKGTKACRGRSIPMGVLDNLVLSALEEKLLQPARLQAILAALAKRHLEQQGQCQEREKALRKELRQVETAIGRLYDAIENGLVDDDDLFRQRLTYANGPGAPSPRP